MASVDSYNNVFGDLAIPLDTYVADVVGTVLDMSGAESLTYFLITATVTDGTWIMSIEDSDVANAGFVPVVAPYVLGGEAVFQGADDDTIYRLGYVGNKRYVRLVVDLAVAGTAVFNAIAVQGHPRVAPTPAQADQ